MKRGEISTILTELIGVVLIVGVIIMMAVIIVRLFSLSGTNDADSKLNMQDLGHQIQIMIDSGKQFQCTDNGLPFYIGKELILVGHDGPFSYNVYSRCTDETAFNSYCHGKGCLCLYDNTAGNDFEDDGWLYKGDNEPKSCFEFGQPVKFLASGDGDPKGIFAGNTKGNVDYSPQAYRDLFLYGNGCSGDGQFGSSRLYAEMYRDKDAVYVYVDEYSEERKGMLHDRCTQLTKKYQPDDYCVHLQDSDLCKEKDFCMKFDPRAAQCA